MFYLGVLDISSIIKGILLLTRYIKIKVSFYRLIPFVTRYLSFYTQVQESHFPLFVSIVGDCLENNLNIVHIELDHGLCVHELFMLNNKRCL